MFNSITWEFFTSAIVIIVTGYYVITTLLLYSKELIDWVKSRSGNPVIPSDTPKHEVPIRNVMGGINPSDTAVEERVTTVAEEVITVASEDEIQEEIHLPQKASVPSSDDHLLVGTVADLLEEVKTLIQLLTEYKSSKMESQAFFHALFIRYPKLQGTSYQDAISLYVAEAAQNHFAFELSHSEINTWWTTSGTTAK